MANENVKGPEHKSTSMPVSATPGSSDESVIKLNRGRREYNCSCAAGGRSYLWKEVTKRDVQRRCEAGKA